MRLAATATLFMAILLAIPSGSFADEKTIPADPADQFCAAYYYVAVASFALGRPTYTEAIKPWMPAIEPYMTPDGQKIMSDLVPLVMRELDISGASKEEVSAKFHALVDKHDEECSRRLDVPRYDLSIVGF